MSLVSDNMQMNAYSSCILCINFYNYKCMLSWFKMIKMIIFLLKRIFLIFHDLIIFLQEFDDIDLSRK